MDMDFEDERQMKIRIDMEQDLIENNIRNNHKEIDSYLQEKL